MLSGCISAKRIGIENCVSNFGQPDHDAKMQAPLALHLLIRIIAVLTPVDVRPPYDLNVLKRGDNVERFFQCYQIT